MVLKSGSLNLLEHLGLKRPEQGLLYRVYVDEYFTGFEFPLSGSFHQCAIVSLV